MKMTLTNLRFVAGGLIITGLMLTAWLLFAGPVPDANREMLATVIAVLGLLSRDATRWIFPPRGNDEDKT